jgi:hypothetical protein
MAIKADQLEERSGSDESLANTGQWLLRILAEPQVLIIVGLFGFVITRVVAVTGGNPVSSLAVVSSVGAPTVVVNTLLSSLGILLAYVLLYATISQLFQPPSDRNWLIERAILFGVLLGILVVPWQLWALSVAVLVLRSLLFRVLLPLKFRGRPEDRKTHQQEYLGDQARSFRKLPRSLINLFVFFVFVWTVMAPMWLPPERISMTTQPDLVGYVLDDSKDWFSVLTADDRVLRINKVGIKDREICRIESLADQEALLHLLRRSAGLPEKVPLCY